MMQNRDAVVIKLRRPNGGKRQRLEELQASYCQALAAGVQAAWQAQKYDPRAVHGLVYPLARQAGLASMYARLVVSDAAGLLRAARRKGPPRAEARNGLGLPANAHRLVNKAGRWAIRLSLGSPGPALWLPMHVPAKLAARMEQVQGDGRLFQRQGEWYAAFRIRTASAPASGPIQTAIGVDLGLARLVTACLPEHILIIRGAGLRQHRQRLAARIHALHRKGRRLQAELVRLKDRRWMRATNHNAASQLANAAAACPGAVLAFENLDGLLYRKARSARFNHMRRAWNFRQLVDFAAYKAAERGRRVVLVDPRGTSSTCPRCQSADARNAAPRGRFLCRQCGYQSLTDIVAARNLAARGRLA